MIEIIVSYAPNSSKTDRAEAPDPESALVAAREMMRDARDHGAGDPRAAFLVDGRAIRSDLRRSEV